MRTHSAESSHSAVINQGNNHWKLSNDSSINYVRYAVDLLPIGDDWKSLVNRGVQEAVGIFEKQTLQLVWGDMGYTAEWRFTLGPVDGNRQYGRVKFKLTLVNYYGISLYEGFSPVKLFLPDTWDPQLYVELTEYTVKLYGSALEINAEAQLDVVISYGARVWLEFLMPAKVLNGQLNTTGVLMVNLNLSLIGTDGKAGDLSDRTVAEVAGELQALEMIRDFTCVRLE